MLDRGLFLSLQAIRRQLTAMPQDVYGQFYNETDCVNIIRLHWRTRARRPRLATFRRKIRPSKSDR